MTTFYVGQRVRIVRSLNYPERVGQEAVIGALFAPGWTQQRGNYLGHQLDIRLPSGRPYVASPENLEPIVDDGRQVISWADCLWQPEGVAA